MDSKKKILQFIRPSFVLSIVFLIPPLTVLWPLVFIVEMVGFIRARKMITKLEQRGELDRAAQELTSADAKRYMNGKAILTEHYLFFKHNHRVFTYDEIVWAYKHRYTKTFFFIPIKVTDSVYLATKDMKNAVAAASMGKDKMDEIKNLIVEIWRHNNQCIVGHNKENVAKFKQLCAK